MARRSDGSQLGHGRKLRALELGNDAELMEVITSANIACGWHGGDPAVMRTTVEMAVDKGVGIGAHVGLPDLLGFGRRRMQVTPDEIYDYTMYQAGALRAFAEAAGGRLQHVKPHGAFYTMSAADEALAAALVRAVAGARRRRRALRNGRDRAGAGRERRSRLCPRRLRRSELRQQRRSGHRAQQGRLGSGGGRASRRALGDEGTRWARSREARCRSRWRRSASTATRRTRGRSRAACGNGWKKRASRSRRSLLGRPADRKFREGRDGRDRCREVLSPLPGLVATVHVKAGDAVVVWRSGVTLQSMKMEIPIAAESDGTIAEVLVSEGDEIDTGAVSAVSELTLPLTLCQRTSSPAEHGETSLEACGIALAAIVPDAPPLRPRGHREGVHDDPNPLFRKVLIANRGEIAVRIARTLREMGIPSVAVYSDADAGATHVEAADEAYHLGPAMPAQSYLNQDRHLRGRARGRGRCDPSRVRLPLGERRVRSPLRGGGTRLHRTAGRTRSRRWGARSRPAARRRPPGCRSCPGRRSRWPTRTRSPRWPPSWATRWRSRPRPGAAATACASSTPRTRSRPTLEGVRRDAGRAFGDTTVYVEKFFSPAPRHVEIQVLGDRSGNVVHLGERECSLQRRFQKIVEETPSPAVSPELRAADGRGGGGAGAGHGLPERRHIECLVADDGDFYFLEMNTRLQVEHPVTEEVTGVDLVREMVRIAAGLPLSDPGGGIAPRGHAIEARHLRRRSGAELHAVAGRDHPAGLPGHAEPARRHRRAGGHEVTVYYDPMIAKVIAWGEDSRRRHPDDARGARRHDHRRREDEHSVPGAHLRR